jgi:diacylglycerol kinase (ATP)
MVTRRVLSWLTWTMVDVDGPAFSAALVIANPAAGTVSPELVAELVELCRPHVHRLSVRWTTERDDVTRIAAEAVARRFDVVIAIGGDGTVREVVEGLLSAGTGDELPALLIIPAGTGNSSYLAQWGDLPWPEAVLAALRGNGSCRCLLDVARLVELDALVLLGACSGLAADALITARSVPAVGRERYRIALAKAAADFVTYPGRVLVDDAVVHAGQTVLVAVGGGRHRAGTYQVLPRSVLDDGLLDVCVIGSEIDPVDVPELTRTGAHLRELGVVYARGRRITVERTDGEPLSFEHDGELRTGTATRFTLQVLPRVLPVLCRSGMDALDGSRQ